MLSQQDPNGRVASDPRTAHAAPMDRIPPPNFGCGLQHPDSKAYLRSDLPGLPDPLTSHLSGVSSPWPQMLERYHHGVLIPLRKNISHWRFGVFGLCFSTVLACICLAALFSCSDFRL